MPSVGPMELVVVLVLALLVLGPRKLPETGRALGEGIRGFKDSITGRGAGERLDTAAERTSRSSDTESRNEPA